MYCVYLLLICVLCLLTGDLCVVFNYWSYLLHVLMALLLDLHTGDLSIGFTYWIYLLDWISILGLCTGANAQPLTLTAN